ncbi:MAG: cysteinyl-tRNA synthetase, partial [Chloroflexi bacterium]|nr:cysteinyl-tRNA synthetase [Chloroflexota bacterium]
MNNYPSLLPGPIAMFGSGETAPGGKKIFDFLFQLLPPSPLVSIIETPAGFELNSQQVAGNVGTFIEHRLQNYKPRIQIIPARKKGTPFSPVDPEIALPI